MIKNKTIGYSAVQCTFWITHACIMGFSSIYLLHAGFTNSQIGMLIAFSGILSAIFQPVVAAYADRGGKLGLKWIIFLLGCTCLLGGLLLFVSGQMKAFTCLCYGACIVAAQMGISLVNSLGVATLNSGEKLNFNIGRSVGSIGYAATVYAVGALSDRWGASILPWCIAAGAVTMLPAAADYREAAKKKPVQADNTRTGNFFHKYPRYCGLLVGLVFIFISHAVINNFTYQITESKGGTSAQMGIATAIGTMTEPIVYPLFSWLRKKMRCDIWFRISGVFYFLKAFATMACGSIYGFYGAQLLQAGAWALMTISAVFYINSIMAPEDTVKGQAWYNVAFTLGSVLSSAIAGRLLDVAGVQAMLLFTTVSAFIGAVLVLLCTQKTE